MKKLDMQIAAMFLTSVYIFTLGIMLMLLDQTVGFTIFMMVGAIEICRTMISPVIIGKQKLEHYAKTTLISIVILIPVEIACAIIYSIIKIDMPSDGYSENVILGLIFLLAISVSLSLSLIAVINMCKEFGDLNYRYIMGKKYKTGKSLCVKAENKLVDEVIHNLTIKNGKYFLISLVTFLLGIILLEMNIDSIGNIVLTVGLVAVVYSNIYVNPKLVEKEKRKQDKIEQKLRELGKYD